MTEDKWTDLGAVLLVAWMVIAPGYIIWRLQQSKAPVAREAFFNGCANACSITGGFMNGIYFEDGKAKCVCGDLDELIKEQKNGL